MEGKKVLRIFAVMLVSVCAFLSGAAAAPSGAMKKEAAAGSARPGPAAKLPEITRIAVFQNQGGEIILRSPLALVRDNKNGDLVITNFDAGEVVILDKNGALVKRMGRESGLHTPYGVAMDGGGKIYVSELKTGQLKVLSSAGALLDEIDLSKARGKVVAPGRVVMGSNGLLYLADLNSNEILVLSDKGEFVRSLGKFEYLQKAGEISGGKVIGLSAQGKAVRIFDKDGALLHSFGEHGDTGEKNVSFPTGFAVDAKERLWIADAFQHRLKVFTLDGIFLFNFGMREEKEGGFFFPADLCFGEAGELFVLEKGASRIQVFRVGDLKESERGKR